MPSRFAPGDVIVLREVWEGRVWTARPMRVVADEAARIALYLAPGTRWKRPAGEDGTLRRLPTPGWVLVDDVWRDTRVLYLTEPGTRHAVHLFWDGAGRFTRWYVNMQTALVRTPLGFDFMDEALDLVLDPDRRRHRWKDDAELDEAVRLGLFTATRAAEARAEGRRVLAAAEAGGGVFGEGWEAWSPDATWPVPELRMGWDVVGRSGRNRPVRPADAHLD